MVYGNGKFLEHEKHQCCFKFPVHMIARICLILALCVLSISLVLDYQDTKLTKTHEMTKWSGTFKSMLTVADLIVVFMALNGNFFNVRGLYVPFFIVHIQYLCAVTVTTCTLLVLWMDAKSDRDFLLNVVIYNVCQLCFMIVVFLFTFRSYRYVNAVHEFIKEARYLDQI
ncbi:hypothetical protein M3Y97_00283800 [Aphelenchoides bicaudatus]|nr:hypothetical protein M3Y97_00283800 [Aphelenchoides bicaudatus]